MGRTETFKGKCGPKQPILRGGGEDTKIEKTAEKCWCPVAARNGKESGGRGKEKKRTTNRVSEKGWGKKKRKRTDGEKKGGQVFHQGGGRPRVLNGGLENEAPFLDTTKAKASWWEETPLADLVGVDRIVVWVGGTGTQKK